MARRRLGSRCSSWRTDTTTQGRGHNPARLRPRKIAGDSPKQRLSDSAVRHGIQFLLADASGLEVDVHAIVFDPERNGVYRMENGQDWIFPAAGFSGWGVVQGIGVRCLTPETQMLCHAHGYVPTEKDLRDMELLQARFGVELPPHLRRNTT